MAEGIAFDLVKEVVGKLGSALWDEIGLLWSFKGDADDLERQLKKIQAVLLDAEERSSVEIEGTHALRIWLSELKGAAYDIDDLLDEIQTQALLRKQQREVQNQNQLAKNVCAQFLSCANPIHLKFEFKMAHRMKELRENIGKIAKQSRDFHLVEAGPSRQAEFKRPETFSVVDEKKIVGRDDDKENIVKLLLDTNGHYDVSVIPIVGLGGLGKTTLAQLAFNDGRVKGEQHFDLRVWICVSTDFNMKTIAKLVITAAGEKCDDLDNLDAIARCLCKIFSEKRFFLVLDDVWNEEQDKWENLKVLFKDGKKGSKILVTTRSEKVAMIMKTVEQPHRVKGLSDDDCWKLFKRRAFEEGEENDYPHLVEIGKHIVNKCGGLPLAVNSLGSMMRFKNRTEDAWLAIRNNEIWTLKEEKTILPSLKLSYIQMPSALKQCFAYCSIFPKNYDIDKDDLIQQWIALGFISSHETSSSMEDIGNEYFNYLLWMYFLQKIMEDDEITYRMHDLVHDLAQSVAREEVVVIDSTSIPEGCRYASIHSRSIQQVPTTVKQRLRALQFGESASLTTFYSEAKCLRLLDLHDSEISMLPSSIGKLKLLRYLNLSATNIQELPKSITGLCNLQTLNLSLCDEIHTLPKFLGRLANLRILNLSKCGSLLSLPSSLCQLKNLHDLNLSDLGDLQALPESIGNLENLCILNLSKCSRLLSLPSSLCQLKNLHDLNLSNLYNLQALPESIGNLENLRIGNLENLRILNLSQCSRLLSLPSSLCQLKNLHDLNLSNLGDLQALPESIGNLENLRILNLSKCSHLLSLPSSLCQLKNLHDLNLSNLDDLQALPESIGNLKNLRILNLSKCSSLLSLPSSSSDLQHLEILDISGCKKLCNLPNTIQKMTNFRELLISKDCLELKAMPLGIGKLVSLPELSLFVIGKQDRVEQCASISKLEHLNNLGGGLEIKGLENVTNPVDAKAANLIEKNLRSLKLKWNVLSAAEDTDTVQPAEEMDAVLENLQPHQNLEKLVIEGYAGGKFPSWMMNRIDSCLPNLVKIKLVNIPRCSSFPPLGQLPVLERLTIRNMAAITNLGVEFDGDSHIINESANKFPALKRLKLFDMPVLREWVPVDDEEGRRERVPIFPRLAELTLERCRQLSASVESLRSFTTLKRLTIKDCEDLERIEDWLGELTELEDLKIDGCSSLRYLPVHKMMTTLTFLYIDNCCDLERIEDRLGELTKLLSLKISRCSSLRYLPVHKMMTTLTYLTIEDCPLLFNECGDVRVNERPEPFLPTSVQELFISGISKEFLSLILKRPTMDSEMPPDNGDVVSLQQPNIMMRRLTIKKCQQLICLPEGLRSFTSLGSMTIEDCEDLERIEDWLGELTKLNFLKINGCSSLLYLPVHKMTTLEELYIKNCPLLFNEGGDVRVNERPEPCLPSSVRRLDISGISKEFLSLILKRPTMDSETPPDDGDAISLQQPNMVLWRLTIENCQQLTCLPEGLRSFTSLDSLWIEDCGDLERIEDWLGELTKLEYLKIRGCQSLRYLPAHKMTSLQYLVINGCPLLFNADGQFVDTNVDHIEEVEVDGRRYRYKKQVRHFSQYSSQEEEKKSWTGCWGKLDWLERIA